MARVVAALVAICALALTLLAFQAGTAPLRSPARGSLTTTSGVGLTAATAPGREVFGFVKAANLASPSVGYTTWDMADLTAIAFFGLQVDPSTGSLITTDGNWSAWNSADLRSMVATAHHEGVKVVLTIVLQNTGAGMCTGLQDRSATVRDTVAQVAQKGVDGVNVDYEGVNAACGGSSTRALFASLVQELRSSLPAAASLTVDTYAASAASTTGFYDLQGMQPSVDAFLVMAYGLDGGYSSGNWQYPPLGCAAYCLSPTAPLTTYRYNDTGTAQQYLAVVPASKIILGIPYFGRSSCVAPLSSPRPGPNALVPPAGSTNPAPHFQSPTYLDSPTANSPGVVSGTFQSYPDTHDGAGQEPYATWQSSTDSCWREAYWDDVSSLGAKYHLVNADDLRGVGIFALDGGGGDRALWNLLASAFPGLRVTSLSPASGSFAGGTSVVIGGRDFASGATVSFGANPAAGVVVNSGTEITAVTPPGVGPVAVTVTNPGGSSSQSADPFTYDPPPYVQYYSWFDRLSAGFASDNVHVLNPGSAPATVVVNIPGAPGCMPYGVIPAGAERYFSCATGFGGPVTVNSDQPVLSSQRVQYGQSFNEIAAQPASAAATTLYFSWFDRVSSPGFLNDNIHVVNPGTAPAQVTVAIPGRPGCTASATVAGGGEWYTSCSTGFGGPVKVTSDQPVLASQRVQYYGSFNEVSAQSASAAQTELYFSWFDRVSSPGFLSDNIHIVNPGTVPSAVTVTVPGQPARALNVTVPAGGEEHLTSATGFGGPVRVSSQYPVLASQRVQYYQSFNEVLAQPPGAAQSTLYFSWFDRVSSPGFLNDNIHVVNPGTTAATVTVAVPGQPACSSSGTIQAGAELYFTCRTGFGGPVKVTGSQPVLASQRVQYYQSFNEVDAFGG